MSFEDYLDDLEKQFEDDKKNFVSLPVENESAELKDLREFLEETLSCFDATGVIRMRQENEILYAFVEGENLAVLIGKNGKTLDAFENIAYAVVNNFNINDINKKIFRVRLDIGGYRENQIELLKKLALQAADLVVKNNKSYTFKPMNSLERRIIHLALENNNKVKTYSIDEGNARRCVIEPV